MTATGTRRDEFIEAARSFLGVPYRYRGRGSSGLDCVGLIVAAASKVGITIELAPYPERPTSIHVYSEIGSYARRLRDHEVTAGDLVLLKGNDQATHFGILTAHGTLIYLSPLRGRVIERKVQSVLDSAVGYYRLKGL